MFGLTGSFESVRSLYSSMSKWNPEDGDNVFGYPNFADGFEVQGVDRVARRLINSPNGTPVTSQLGDKESLEISIPVPDGETLTVYRWGGYKISDGTAPAGLDCQLLDGNDTVKASENTTDTSNVDGVVSHTNSSGSESIFKLRVFNDTGTNFSTDGVGGIFGYEVS